MNGRRCREHELKGQGNPEDAEKSTAVVTVLLGGQRDRAAGPASELGPPTLSPSREEERFRLAVSDPSVSRCELRVPTIPDVEVGDDVIYRCCDATRQPAKGVIAFGGSRCKC
jgi:hypothetical protein